VPGARSATRAAEIAVRTALGASRRRIVTQLFAEACVLAAVSAAVALILLQIGFVQIESAAASLIPEGLPFWIDLHISPAIIVNAAGLALIGALIAGLYPALKVAPGRWLARGQPTRLAGTWRFWRCFELSTGAGWESTFAGRPAHQQTHARGVRHPRCRRTASSP
jgi:hypothetical protein